MALRFLSFCKIEQYVSEMTVVPGSIKSMSKTPSLSQNAETITFPADGTALNVFSDGGEDVRFHATDPLWVWSEAMNPCLVTCDYSGNRPFVNNAAIVKTCCHMVDFVLVSEFLKHSPCRDFTILQFLRNDAVRRSIIRNTEVLSDIAQFHSLIVSNSLINQAMLVSVTGARSWLELSSSICATTF